MNKALFLQMSSDDPKTAPPSGVYNKFMTFSDNSNETFSEFSFKEFSVIRISIPNDNNVIELNFSKQPNCSGLQYFFSPMADIARDITNFYWNETVLLTFSALNSDIESHYNNGEVSVNTDIMMHDRFKALKSTLSSSQEIYLYMFCPFAKPSQVENNIDFSVRVKKNDSSSDNNDSVASTTAMIVKSETLFNLLVDKANLSGSMTNILAYNTSGSGVVKFFGSDSEIPDSTVLEVRLGGI